MRVRRYAGFWGVNIHVYDDLQGPKMYVCYDIFNLCDYVVGEFPTARFKQRENLQNQLVIDSAEFPDA